ncbi:hypothetical protein MTO96_039401, partial [Rhipicephalus appendiculatus]
PTCIGNSVCRDITLDLSFCHSVRDARWSNTHQSLGSDHDVLTIQVITSLCKPRQHTARHTDWDAFRERRLHSANSSIEDLSTWTDQLLADVDAVTLRSPPRRTIRQSTPALPTCGPLVRDSPTVGISNVTTVAYTAASHTSIVLLRNTPPCLLANSGNNSARGSPVSWAANNPGISSGTSSTLLLPSWSLCSNYNEWSATLRR